MKITLHWTAGTYAPNDIERRHYHILIGAAGEIWKCHNLTVKLEHTWQENTDNIGIAVCAMHGATPDKFGAFPVTAAQFDAMFKVAALVCRLKKIPFSQVKTHAERAIEKGYFGEKWDFACLKPDRALTPQNALEVGKVIRQLVAVEIDSITDPSKHKYYREISRSVKG